MKLGNKRNDLSSGTSTAVCCESYAPHPLPPVSAFFLSFYASNICISLTYCEHRVLFDIILLIISLHTYHDICFALTYFLSHECILLTAYAWRTPFLSNRIACTEAPGKPTNPSFGSCVTSASHACLCLLSLFFFFFTCSWVRLCWFPSESLIISF